MHRRLSAALLVGAAALSRSAYADAPAASPSPSAQQPARGLAVLTAATAEGVESPAASAADLARAVYAVDALRPAALSEAEARVLTGEAPAANATKDLTDLADTRAAIRGDDAPSRQLLASLASRYHLRGVVVVFARPAGPGPEARVFVAQGEGGAAFDAASYAPDPPVDGTSAVGSWAGAVKSLARAYGAEPPVSPRVAGPALATAPAPAPTEGQKDPGSRHFYTSGWFWGAIGAAAFGGVALYFATRDNSSATIHLQAQVPK